MSRLLNRLWVRLSLLSLIVAWLSVAMVALVVRESTDAGFRRYVNQRNTAIGTEQLARLQAYYVANGSWEGAASLLQVQGGGPGGGQGSGQDGGQHNADRRGAQTMIAGTDGLVIAATDPALAGTLLTPEELAEAIPIMVGGEVVGLAYRQTPGAQVLGEAEARFLAESTQWLTLAALGGAGLAVVASGLLAWTLARPLRALTMAAHELAGGQLGKQVTVRGAEEIRDLAASFNAMSDQLAQGEALRRRMAADVAHELRTPVSVLRGHLEAMMDGVFPVDHEHLAVVYDQTLHLARLVEDLRLLTVAEAGKLPLDRVPFAPGVAVEQVVESFAPLALDAGVRLTAQVADDLPSILVDPVRMRQILSNLLANALRHTPPEGEISLNVDPGEGHVRFTVRNTGSTLSEAEIAQVFSPFWRGEIARDRDKGGSGLGLAIAQQLVAMHGGTIRAEAGQDCITFVVEIPTGALPMQR